MAAAEHSAMAGLSLPVSGVVMAPEPGLPLRSEALHDAVRKGDLAAAEAAMTRGAEVNDLDEEGRTALHLAAQAGNVAVAQLLLARGAISFLRAHDGNTPLHLACRSGCVPLATLLLGLRAEANDVNGRGETPLRVCVETLERPADLVRVLCEYGADPNAIGRDGRAVLHLAAAKGAVDVLKELAASGRADWALVNAAGRTPIHEAMASGMLDCVSFLLPLSPLDAKDKENRSVLDLAPHAARQTVAALFSAEARSREPRQPPPPPALDRMPSQRSLQPRSSKLSRHSRSRSFASALPLEYADADAEVPQPGRTADVVDVWASSLRGGSDAPAPSRSTPNSRSTSPSRAPGAPRKKSLAPSLRDTHADEHCPQKGGPTATAERCARRKCSVITVAGASHTARGDAGETGPNSGASAGGGSGGDGPHGSPCLRSANHSSSSASLLPRPAASAQTARRGSVLASAPTHGGRSMGDPFRESSIAALKRTAEALQDTMQKQITMLLRLQSECGETGGRAAAFHALVAELQALKGEVRQLSEQKAAAEEALEAARRELSAAEETRVETECAVGAEFTRLALERDRLLAKLREASGKGGGGGGGGESAA